MCFHLVNSSYAVYTLDWDLKKGKLTKDSVVADHPRAKWLIPTAIASIVNMKHQKFVKNSSHQKFPMY